MRMVILVVVRHPQPHPHQHHQLCVHVVYVIKAMMLIIIMIKPVDIIQGDGWEQKDQNIMVSDQVLKKGWSHNNQPSSLSPSLPFVSPYRFLCPLPIHTPIGGQRTGLSMFWDCCDGMDINSPGCKTGPHVPYAADWLNIHIALKEREEGPLFARIGEKEMNECTSQFYLIHWNDKWKEESEIEALLSNIFPITHPFPCFFANSLLHPSPIYR